MTLWTNCQNNVGTGLDVVINGAGPVFSVPRHMVTQTIPLCCG